jgi:hypothetical protein
VIEYNSPVPGLDSSGRGINFGWSRQPNFEFDYLNLRRPRRLLSLSDRYIIVSPTAMLIIQVMDAGWMGVLTVTLAVLNPRERGARGGIKRSSQVLEIPLTMGNLELPISSVTGDFKLERKGITLSFCIMAGGVRIVKIDVSQFSKKRRLRGELVLSPLPGSESLTTHACWPAEKGAQLVTRRAPTFTAEGVIQVGAEEHVFAKPGSWGILDWTRGSRPRKNAPSLLLGAGRIINSPSTETDTHSLGFSLDFSPGFSLEPSAAGSPAATENAFFLDGKCRPFDLVPPASPPKGLEAQHFASIDGSFEVDFQPRQFRQESHRLLFSYLNRRQYIGSCSGRVRSEEGRDVFFRNISGFAERRRSKG